MSTQQRFWEFAKDWQQAWDDFKREVKRHLDAFEPITIIPYRGHATADRVLRVKGRVVEQKGVEKSDESAGVLRSAANTFERIESDEIPAARIVARHGETVVGEARSDNEGFFRFDLEADSDLDPGWTEVEIELIESMGGGEGTTVVAPVLVPPADAEFGIISDVDDTVLETHATDIQTQIRLIFSNSPQQRSPMPGAGPLYQALETGPDESGANPFFYVSNSGWGLYDLIDKFLDHHDMPLGPLYLQDIAIIERKSRAIGSHDHKIDTINGILDDYPDLPFVLIGDSGQQDPETYQGIVEDRADRLRAVLVRDVTPPDRDAEVRQIVQEINEAGVAAAAAESSVSLARAASDFGLIPEAAIDRVRQAMVEEQRSAAGPDA